MSIIVKIIALFICVPIFISACSKEAKTDECVIETLNDHKYLINKSDIISNSPTHIMFKFGEKEIEATYYQKSCN